MDVEKYLERLGIDRPGPPDRVFLTGLVIAHLTAVPFENLDIMSGRDIILRPEAIYEKVVKQRRADTIMN